METKIMDCIGCGKQPDTWEHIGAGLRIGCSECERYIIEPDEATIAIEYWNIFNMDYDELAHFAITRMKEQSDTWLNLVRKHRDDIWKTKNP